LIDSSQHTHRDELSSVRGTGSKYAISYSKDSRIRCFQTVTKAVIPPFDDCRLTSRRTMPNGKPVWYQPPASVHTSHYKARGLSHHFVRGGCAGMDHFSVHAPAMAFDDLSSLLKVVVGLTAPPLLTVLCWPVGRRMAGFPARGHKRSGRRRVLADAHRRLPDLRPCSRGQPMFRRERRCRSNVANGPIVCES
jgi:hypothetical protein